MQSMFMRRQKRIRLPKRPLKRTTFTVPVDRLEFLDECAEATGFSRSGFLSMVLDGFEDEIASFAKGYIARLIKEIEDEKRVESEENAEKVGNVQTRQR